jgi:glycosyltransferase involved in cell wall biosynthesis
LLATAFAAVPGSSPHGAALLAMATAIRADLDLVTLKTENLSHVERIGEARMFRVPIGQASQLEQRAVFGRAIARQLESEHYDVVHVRGPFEGAVAASRKSTLGFRLIYEMATFPDEALGPAAEKGWVDSHANTMAEADLVLVPTEAAQRAIAELVSPERVQVLPPGVDVGLFDWRETRAATAPRLLYLGSFTTDRDLATMLGAIRTIAKHRSLSVLVAGDTDRQRRKNMRAMVQAFGLESIVEVRGEPASRLLPQIIAGASLCVAPAAEAPRFQSFGDLPQPLLEYLACHRPVVAAGVPGVSDVVRDEQEGLLYPPGDESALAESILQMWNDTELQKRTSDAGYRKVRDVFSLGARQRRLADIYERMFPGSQVGDPWLEAFDEPQTGSFAASTSVVSMWTEDSGDTLRPPDDELLSDTEHPGRDEREPRDTMTPTKLSPAASNPEFRRDTDPALLASEATRVSTTPETEQ